MIGDRDVSTLPPRARGLAMVFQNYAVFPHLTVFEKFAFGLRMAKAAENRVKQQVEKTANLMHIEQLLRRYPAQLSGGQRQRVAVARALAVEPAVMLMDEPLSNLDALLRMEMRAELKGILQNAGTTTIYVTHDQTEAMGLADRIAVMHGGVIEQVAPPMEIYRSPATIFVGGFVGNPPMNFMKRRAENGAVKLGPLSLPTPLASGDILLGIRPEDVAPIDAAHGFAFDVTVVEPLGAQTLQTGKVDGETIRVAAPPEVETRAGAQLHLRPLDGRVRWMDPNTGKTITHAA